MDKIEELVDSIKLASADYYEGRIGITDSEFDDLILELRRIDPENPILEQVGWGYDFESKSKVKYDHMSPCLGISDKRFVENDFDLSKVEGILTGKLDGGNVELIYKNGNLFRALTRGDGKSGFDVTDKLKLIVPNKLTNDFTGNVIGEFILPECNYEKFESDSVRNIPNGFLNRKEVTKEECELFSFVAYKVYRYRSELLESGSNTDSICRISIIDFLEMLGFEVVKCFEVDKGDKYSDLIQLLCSSNKDKKYLLDGIVVSKSKVKIEVDGDYNNLIYEDYALKTRTDTAEVEVRSIDWNMTRTGKMVPVINYDPTWLSGATCKRASAFNAKNVLDSKIGVGSKIKVVRSGEVIPYILNVIEESEVELPRICPDCGSELIWSNKDLICDNVKCKSKIYNNVYRWLEVLGVTKNIGSSLINDLIVNFKLESIEDIYNSEISFEDLNNIEGLGQAKIELVVQLFKNLYQPHSFIEYLVALNIPKINWSTAEKLVNGTEISTADLNDKNFVNNQLVNQLLGIKGIGSSVTSSILQNIELIRDNLKFLRLSEVVEENVDNSSKCKIYVTGKLSTFKNRSELYSELSDKVVECKDIKTCDFFVTNKQPLTTNHYKEALAKGIKVVSELEFLEELKRR